MEIQDKVAALASAAQYDVCGYSGIRAQHSSPLRFIHRAILPGGSSICLLKILLTNVCINDCAYCVNQIGRDIPRHSLQPGELAKVFMELHTKNLVQGLFLSSGIGRNAAQTMESMIQTVEILRQHYEFKGYIHLKILPGASFDCVAEACKLANRVSVNMEAPTAYHLAKLSAKKDLYQGIIAPMRWVKRLMATEEKLVPSGQTTQFVAGAAGETDREILHTTEALYQEIGLRRVYFSAFQPVTGSRLEGFPATPPMREHRLYQADWLLRVYGFRPQELELAFGEKGNLPLTKDPKLVIARQQPWLFPVDVNRASYEELIRVPGVGPLSAKRIVESRKWHSIGSLEQLKKMRVVTKRAAPFIWFQGRLDYEKQTSFLREVDARQQAPAPSLAEIT